MERLLARALDESQEAVFGILPSGAFFYVNHNACRALGLSREELLALGVSDIDPLFPVAQWSAHWEEVRQSGGLTLETIHRRKDGQEFPVEVRTSILELEGQERMFAYARDLTARKAAEEARRESETLYQTLFQTMAQGVVYQDAAGKIMTANPSAERILGLSLDQLMGRTSLDPRWQTIHPDGSDFLGEEHPAMVALRTGTPVLDEVIGIYHPGEGRHRWVLVSAIPHFQEGNSRPSHVFATITDITEQKRIQDELRAAEGRLHTVISGSQAVIYQLDPEGRFTLSEGRGLEGLGLLPGQVVGLSALDVYADAPEVLDQLRRALAGELIRAMAEVGGRIYDNLITPVFDSQGRVESVIGIATDITSWKQAENELRASEASYRGLFDSVQEAVYIQDAAGRFLDVNPGALNMYGYTREEILGRTPEFLSAPGLNDLPAVVACVERAFAGEPQHFEFWGLRKNGEVFPKEVRIYPGSYLGQKVVVALSMDISERRRSEEALRQAQKLESLGVLAGGIAHDFNNLLTAMMGNLNLAQMSLPEVAPAQPFLDAVERTVLKASDLTKQMLAYSGKGRFVVKAHDLNVIVQEMLHLLQVSISKKADLRIELQERLPAILAEAAQVQQVVMNLVTNASDALGAGQGVIRVGTFLERLDAAAIQRHFPNQELQPGDFVVLEISDTGCGIPEAVRNRIFDPFFTTKTSGRGLGLSALLGILKGHKAGIRIRSEVGKGSTFEILFPASETSVPSVPLPGDGRAGSLTGTVLLVDDEEMILESTGMALESMGLTVVTAHDGLQGLERFLELAPTLSLVLMDLSMPRMDGATAFLAMHQAHPDIPILLSSGYDAHESGDDLLAKGLAGFIQKPYRMKELAATLVAAMAQKPVS